MFLIYKHLFRNNILTTISDTDIIHISTADITANDNKEAK